MIGTAESDFADQILINPLRTQPAFQLGFDAFAMSITETGPARLGLQRRADQVRTVRFRVEMGDFDDADSGGPGVEMVGDFAAALR